MNETIETVNEPNEETNVVGGEPEPELEQERPKRRLPCPMTDAEHRELGRNIATLVGEAEDLEARKKSSASDYKAQQDKLAERIQTLSRQLRAGTVERDVEVSIEQDLVHGEEIITRLDTGEVVNRRTLTAAEMKDLRQVKVPGTEQQNPEPDQLPKISEEMAQKLVDVTAPAAGAAPKKRGRPKKGR